MNPSNNIYQISQATRQLSFIHESLLSHIEQAFFFVVKKSHQYKLRITNYELTNN